MMARKPAVSTRAADGERDGPAAVVMLSCGGCRHLLPGRGPHDDGICKAAGRVIPFDPDASWTPDFCPRRPGPLTAVPVAQLRPGAAFPDAMMARIGTHGFTAALKLSLVDAARALGQEVADV